MDYANYVMDLCILIVPNAICLELTGNSPLMTYVNVMKRATIFRLLILVNVCRILLYIYIYNKYAIACEPLCKWCTSSLCLTCKTTGHIRPITIAGICECVDGYYYDLGTNTCLSNYL